MANFEAEADANHATQPTNERVIARVDGWPIHLPDLRTAVAKITERAIATTTDPAAQGFTVFTLNMDHLVKLRRFHAFDAAYRQAGLITADGAPVVWLGRKQAPRLVRTTGADLFVPLACAAARSKLPVYLFGATDDVLTRTATALRQETRGRIEIAGFAAPSATFDPEGPEADAAIAAIKASGARVVFVALGAPKQEVFSARAVTHGCRAAFICIGAAVDFLAGTQVRAPAILQKSGLEWAWRLATNPRRLFTRYAACAGLLLDVAVVTPMVRPFVIREI